MMDSLSVRAVLKVMEPPMALRVLVEDEDEDELDTGEERKGTVDKSGLGAKVGGKKKGGGEGENF